MQLVQPYLVLIFLLDLWSIDVTLLSKKTSVPRATNWATA